jgi:hypothetical protein
MELKDLVKKQMKRQFQKDLEERVAKEDLIEWSRRKTYTEEINEKLQTRLKEEKPKRRSIITLIKEVINNEKHKRENQRVA